MRLRVVAAATPQVSRESVVHRGAVQRDGGGVAHLHDGHRHVAGSTCAQLQKNRRRVHLPCEPTSSTLNIIWSCGLFEGKGVSTSRVRPTRSTLNIIWSCGLFEGGGAMRGAAVFVELRGGRLRQRDGPRRRLQCDPGNAPAAQGPNPRLTSRFPTPTVSVSSSRWRAIERRHPTGRERMSSPTLQTLQDPILRLPRLCFRGGGFPNPLAEDSIGGRAGTDAREGVRTR